MKKLITIILALAMVLSLASCGGSSDSSAGSTDASEAASTGETSGDSSEFSWDKYAGEEINIMFVEHTLTTNMINEIEGFEELTGITVNYTTIPEANYFDKISALLSSQSDTKEKNGRLPSGAM